MALFNVPVYWPDDTCIHERVQARDATDAAMKAAAMVAPAPEGARLKLCVNYRDTSMVVAHAAGRQHTDTHWRIGFYQITEV